MPEWMIRYSYVSICLAVLLEELGIPMPIPTDLLIVFAGISAGHSGPKFVLWFVLLSISAALGSSGMYWVVRRGGRPLVERFGKYVHIGPKQLEQAEHFVNRWGWWGIAGGRAVPGLRYVTVIGCGLLQVPFRRFLTAHFVGSSIYILVFLWLGSRFGTAIVAHMHAPERMIRLLWLLLLSIGLPSLFVWFCRKDHIRQVSEPSEWRQVSALAVANLVGITAMAGTWSGAALLSEIFGDPQSIDFSVLLARWLISRGFLVGYASSLLIVYSGLLLVCALIGMLYYKFVHPRFARWQASFWVQALGLALVCAIVVLFGTLTGIAAGQLRPLERWWRTNDSLIILSLLLGVASYAITMVHARALAISMLPSFRRYFLPSPARQTPEQPSNDDAP